MKKSLFIGGTVLLLAVAGYFSLPPYRHWKQQRFLNEARAAIAKADYRSAALSVRQALNLNAADLEACRLMARITENIHSPVAVDWWQKIVNLDPTSVSNRLDFARAALVFGNYVRADQALGGMPKAGQDSELFHQLAGMVAAAENNLALADWHFAKAAEIDPQNKSVQFNEAVLHLQAKNPDLVRAAEQTMLTLADDPLFHKSALRLLTLAAIQKQDYVAAEKYAGDLLASPDATFDDHLTRLAILKAEVSPDFEAEVAKLKTVAAKNPDDSYTLAAWFTAHEMGDTASAWLAALPDNLQTQSAVRMARAETLMARKNWTGLEDLLNDQNWNELEFLRLAQLARAARELNQNMVYQAEWQAAVHAAGDKVKELSLLARLANAWDWDKEREDLLWDIVQRYPGERWALKALDQLYTTTGNTPGLQKVYATLASYDTTDPVALNNLASILMLLNVQTSRAYQMAHDAYSQHTNVAAFASTYAFSLHLQGQTAEGLKILNALPPAQLEQPGMAVYYGVLLSANGETNKAKKYLDIAAAAPLLPEEQSLVKAARAGM